MCYLEVYSKVISLHIYIYIYTHTHTHTHTHICICMYSFSDLIVYIRKLRLVEVTEFSNKS